MRTRPSVREVKQLNPELLDRDGGALLKPLTMSLFGVLNWTYLWFREDGKLSHEDYAQVATRLCVEGVARLTQADEPRERATPRKAGVARVP